MTGHGDQARADQLRQQTAERIRHQTRGPFAARRTRVRLAYGYVASVALASASALALQGLATALVQLGALIVMVALWFALRRATRLVADAPEEALDELMVRLRNRAFLTAYQFLAATVVLVAAVLFASGPSGIEGPLATALAWAAFGAALGLPLVVTAVAFPDDDPEA
jgi:hypothetical protein